MKSVTTNAEIYPNFYQLGKQHVDCYSKSSTKKESATSSSLKMYRSQARQNYLYAQGRTRPGPIVTLTLNSNHKSRLVWDITVGLPQSL
ncbi:hypothetical protein ACQKII_14440 [Lysinibacillus sp. NPDC048646]|uniref:hypothetical protein n=1 Tax=Lysinibacillus sp. NPDC048646 TaxID=3390574 RepID=UPI003D0235F2